MAPNNLELKHAYSPNFSAQVHLISLGSLFVGSQDSLTSDRPEPTWAEHSFPTPAAFTFQVQVLGAHGGLRGDLGINLDRVQVVGVTGDVHVVPVVVVEWAVGVALDQVSAVAQVGDVVQVAAARWNAGSGTHER